MEYNKETDTIIFKSNPEFYEKEQSGLKCNTVRILTVCEAIETSQNNPRYIMIRNSETNECFRRIISDISMFLEKINGFDYLFIFSWKEVF